MRFVVDTGDYEAAVLYTALQRALGDTLRLAVDNPTVRDHFERSFWHVVSMMQRMYPRR